MIDLTYIVIPASLFIAASLCAFFIKRGAVKSAHVNAKDQIFRVSIWYWGAVVFVAFAILGVVFSLGTMREGGWIVGLLMTSPVSCIVLFATYCGLRCYIQISNERVIYYNGFKKKDFSLKGIVSCKVDNFYAIEIRHSKNPKVPLRIGACYKNISKFVAICQRAASNET